MIQREETGFQWQLRSVQMEFTELVLIGMCELFLAQPAQNLSIPHHMLDKTIKNARTSKKKKKKKKKKPWFFYVVHLPLSHQLKNLSDFQICKDKCLYTS